MISNLAIFKNENFGEVRTLLINNEPWFVLKDVCDSLGLSDTHKVANRIDEDDRTQIPVVDSLGRNQDMIIINESGLYTVILRNDKQEAKQFKKWLTHEVIPEIRKTGMYSNIPKSYSEALRIIANEVEQKELMQNQRDEATKTKSYISDKKTATALATASVKSREFSKLKNETENLKVELDLSKQFATVKFCEAKTKKKFDWRKLRDYCNMNELEMRKIFDANYGEVNSYPAKAWKCVYGVKI